MLTRCLLLLLVLTVGLRADDPKPPALTPEEQKLADEARKLDDEGVRLYQQGRAADAVEKLRKSLELYRKVYPTAKYPDGHLDLATSLNDLAVVLAATGQAEQALQLHREDLEMKRKLYPTAKYPDGHPELAVSLNNVGYVLVMMGRSEQALPFQRQCLEMVQKLYPASKFPYGHPVLAGCLNSMGAVLRAVGQPDQALPFFRQTLEMSRKLFPEARFPNGHPQLASTLNNLAFVLQETGQADQAVTVFRQSLEMYQKLYPPAKFPDGHPDLATSLNNLAFGLSSVGQLEQAVPFYRDGLAMYQKLYPAAKYPVGHPVVASSLNSMGVALETMGQAEDALPFFRQSLEMRQKLFPAANFPDGHSQIATSFFNLGYVQESLGQPEKAVPDYRRSLDMTQRLLRRELATASEEAAFDKVQALPRVRDAYLSVTRSATTPAAEVVRDIWPARSMVTRLLEQRQADARAAGTAVGDKLDQLRGLRRQLDNVLQDRRMNPADRDKLLVEIADARDKLEREVAAHIPALKRRQELDQLGPADLVAVLPQGAVFVDVIRYIHSELVERKPKYTPRYVAFVLAKGPTIQRVEFGEAGPIDAATRDWRTAIEVSRAAPAAAELARRVWEPIAKALPAGTTTLYLATDGDLARLPWPALPVGGGRVLLEDYALAQVPHGTFLLDQLEFGKTVAGNAVLALGGVDYGPGVWPSLPGTAVEARAVAAVAPAKHETLGGKDATTEKLKTLLPQAQFVHLATHGEFKADELTAEKQRAAKALESQRLGDDSRKVAVKNPLGYVGIVLANGEILSGLGIVDLPLQNTKLVTLSACETGLGDLTGGEGVQGLQRAIHLAGCPNVVASLWKVNDAATAALMAKFYHELWVNKKEPLAALREAQLTIYHHPELIPDLTGERGAPKFKDAVAVKASDPAKQQAARADTKLWAAFVLSGVGK